MVKIVDCTLRDGGYYNRWDFSLELIEQYMKAMEAISIDFIEVGFRTLSKIGYKGGCGYSTDNYLNSLQIPKSIKLAVMINAGELLRHPEGVIAGLQKLFSPAADSPVTLVRIACHMPEIEPILPGITWLKDQGYLVSINFMQIAERTEDEILHIARLVSDYPLDILYFADSMGSLKPKQTSEIIHTLQRNWRGQIGIHTHDNMCMGLANSIRAVEEGVTWIDGTVNGMGRGPGNAKTEYLVIELEPYRQVTSNPTKLFALIRKHFQPMQNLYGWGPNPFYYLTGKYGIHPTYVQEMLGDTRYDEEDILAIIEHLRKIGGKKFNLSTLEAARNFYDSEPDGTWCPADLICGREVLILGSGTGVSAHKKAIENYCDAHRPFVIALNTQAGVDDRHIDIRAACHPVRLLADCREHALLKHPLAIPISQLPEYIHTALGDRELLDYGLKIQKDTFVFEKTHCILPNSQVVAYAIAIATSGRANRILLAGFDGYGAEDPRNVEMDALINLYTQQEEALPVVAITPSRYKVPKSSVYSLL